MTELKLTVSQFIDFCNQSLDYAFPSLVVEGEVASFKINQNKWVFFDLKDTESTIGCFMTVSQLNIALADGMKVQVWATPGLTRWGKFSLTVHKILPVGEGSIKKSFELLKRKLAAEGLFDPAKKRQLPDKISKIGVISSVAAAGYIDFLKILNNRWGGLQIYTINTAVQGVAASEQMIRALEHFNQHGEVEVIALLRGGGSADDLAAFNDEHLARAIAASRIPVLTGIGHEIDESLADLAADVRASTPSNAAERLVPDRQAIARENQTSLERIRHRIFEQIDLAKHSSTDKQVEIGRRILAYLEQQQQHMLQQMRLLDSLNPERILDRGYVIVTGGIDPGSKLKITTKKYNITAEVKNAIKRA